MNYKNFFRALLIFSLLTGSSLIFASGNGALEEKEAYSHAPHNSTTTQQFPPPTTLGTEIVSGPPSMLTAALSPDSSVPTPQAPSMPRTLMEVDPRDDRATSSTSPPPIIMSSSSLSSPSVSNSQVNATTTKKKKKTKPAEKRQAEGSPSEEPELKRARRPHEREADCASSSNVAGAATTASSATTPKNDDLPSEWKVFRHETSKSAQVIKVGSFSTTLSETLQLEQKGKNVTTTSDTIGKDLTEQFWDLLGSAPYKTDNDPNKRFLHLHCTADKGLDHVIADTHQQVVIFHESKTRTSGTLDLFRN